MQCNLSQKSLMHIHQNLNKILYLLYSLHEYFSLPPLKMCYNIVVSSSRQKHNIRICDAAEKTFYHSVTAQIYFYTCHFLYRMQRR